MEEIGYALGVCRLTFQHLCRRDPEVRKRIAIGQAKGKRALRAVQFKVALSGNTSLLIWLGRCILGQCPRDEMHMHINGDASDATELSEPTKEHLTELARHIQQLAVATNSREVETEVIGRDGTVGTCRKSGASFGYYI
jgi:hypothetical protein